MPHGGLSRDSVGNADILGSPPPTPRLEQDPTRPPTSLSELAGPAPVAPDQIPAPVLQGMVSFGTEMSTGLDSIAQAAPQLSTDVLLVKTALQRLLAKLLEAGAPPPSPTAAGAEFPAGGLVPAGPASP